MIPLLEMQQTLPMELHDGVIATTTDVWDMLSASRDGDLQRIVKLAEHRPSLRTCQYDYTSPLHMAVREGHLDVVRYFVEQGALDPGYKTHPFGDPLVTFAEDRDQQEIAELLKRTLDNH